MAGAEGGGGGGGGGGGEGGGGVGGGGGGGGGEWVVGKEVAGELVEAGGDASEVLELAEEALDEVALTIQGRVDAALELAVTEGRDVRLAAAGAHEIEDGLCVIASIGDERLCGRQVGQQGWGDRLVGGLPRADHEPQRQPGRADHGVDLGAQSSTRTANGVIRAPFMEWPAPFLHPDRANRRGGTMRDLKIIGVDLGKNVCSLVGLNAAGGVVMRRRVRREGLLALLTKLPGSVIVAMEACCGAHYLGRLLTGRGLEVRLMSPEYVRPYVKAQKNDDRDAEAIAEAATRPTRPRRS